MSPADYRAKRYYPTVVTSAEVDSDHLKERKMTTHYHVGNGTPGCLYDSEPAAYGTLESALESVREFVDSERDSTLGDDAPAGDDSGWPELPDDMPSALTPAQRDSGYVARNDGMYYVEWSRCDDSNCELNSD